MDSRRGPPSSAAAAKPFPRPWETVGDFQATRSEPPGRLWAGSAHTRVCLSSTCCMTSTPRARARAGMLSHCWVNGEAGSEASGAFSKEHVVISDP